MNKYRLLMAILLAAVLALAGGGTAADSADPPQTPYQIALAKVNMAADEDAVDKAVADFKKTPGVEHSQLTMLE